MFSYNYSRTRQDTVYWAYYLLPAQEIFMLQEVEGSSTSYNPKKLNR